MKSITQKQRNNIKGCLIIVGLILGSFANAQTQMYGDTIFWENFGNGSIRSDIIGLGQIGGMYKYEGSMNYVYALNPQKLTDYKTANSGKTYVTEDVTFHDVPLLTTEIQYSYKPSSAGPAWTNNYFNITSWRNRTFSSVINASTQNAAAWDDTFYTYATGYETQIPCAWLWVDGEWKFGFYYITYENTSRCTVPDDGHYAIVNNLDIFNCGGTDVNWLPNGFKDHTGFVNDTLSPITSGYARVSSNDDGRMLFINCAAVNGISSPVYKRLVPELCRDAWFEFSAWFASVQTSINNAQFRIELWSADPGNDPSLGDLDANYEGLTISKANNARLIKVGTTSPLGVAADLGKWFHIKENFKLTGQDYVWVVVRNYGQGGSGNDIVLDDLVFKPWAPFNLSVKLSASSLANACVDGIVTLLSDFPAASSIPGYINIPEYAFYFEGLKDGTWVKLGNAYPLQTQSAEIPLEVTIPLSEYVLYSKFRISVATTPAGFGGKCVTFTETPTDIVPISSAPTLKISGKDVCDDGSGTQKGNFVIKNYNQVGCTGWHVKVKMPDGSYQTFTPVTKASCP